MAKVFGYKTYSFKRKDPAIDLLRTAIDVAGVSYKQVSDGTGIHIATLRAWFFGETERPKHCTVQAVARFLHKEFRLMDIRR
jgi:hypothetical protein